MTTYICAWCGENKELTTTPEEMEKDFSRDFPGSSKVDRDIVCSECWEIVKPKGRMGVA